MISYYQEVRHELKTGDIFLFWGKGLVSRLIEVSGPSHIGMVVKVSGWDLVFCWESTTLSDVADMDSGQRCNGVQLVPMSERIAKFKGDVTWRRLVQPLSEYEICTLIDMRRTWRGKPYEKNKLNLLRAFLRPSKLVEDTRSVFCSETVAEFMRRAGRLPGGTPSSAYIPNDWREGDKRYPWVNPMYAEEVTVKEA